MADEKTQGRESVLAKSKIKMGPGFRRDDANALGSRLPGNDESGTPPHNNKSQKRNERPKAPAALPITDPSADQNRHCPLTASRLPELSK